MRGKQRVASCEGADPAQADGTGWSNPLHFTYSASGTDAAAAADAGLMAGQLALVQTFVQTCCGATQPQPQTVNPNPNPNRARARSAPRSHSFRLKSS